MTCPVDLLHTAYIALGSNIGDKEKYIIQALDLLNAENNLRISALSKMYKTDPVGYTDQDFFLNMVCRIETDLSPNQLLDVLHKIENDLQRKRIIRWGPRTIDLDILLYDDLESCDPVLTVPHPRMTERAFVMVPLGDVYHVDTFAGKPIAEIIASCDDCGGVEFFKDIDFRIR
ncbi:MAG: hypothetical protein Ta2F_08130 [Termitinemataceae bacterium]|nr:MAG: hypothetical protein Ta2F_08130 [Termitinemataceae bacterium]